MTFHWSFQWPFCSHFRPVKLGCSSLHYERPDSGGKRWVKKVESFLQRPQLNLRCFKTMFRVFPLRLPSFECPPFLVASFLKSEVSLCKCTLFPTLLKIVKQVFSVPCPLQIEFSIKTEQIRPCVIFRPVLDEMPCMSMFKKTFTAEKIMVVHVVFPDEARC